MRVEPSPTASDSSDSWRPAKPDQPVAHWPAESSASSAKPLVSLALVNEGQAQGQTGSVALRINPPIQDQYVAPEEKRTPDEKRAPELVAPTNLSRPGTVTLPTKEPARMVNARVFELEYNAESVGPSGIGRVEVWGTRDNGQTWKNYGVDTRGHSPLVVTVDGEGLFGFRLAIQSGAGLGGQPPRAGDQPEIWIGVDLTKPTGRITGARPGADSDPNKLTVTWEAADNMKLAARPIAISYSETLGGPWTVIAKDLENTGRFVWTLPKHVPQRLYLRLEVCDAAGNVGIFESREPLSLDRSVPVARILDARPVR